MRPIRISISWLESEERRLGDNDGDEALLNLLGDMRSFLRPANGVPAERAHVDES
jgi:hypothetical protein